MNTHDINTRITNLGGRHVPFANSRIEAIGFIYSCDMMTAQNIINRIGDKIGVGPKPGIGHDPVIVLKTAEPLQICEGILEELEPKASAPIKADGPNLGAALHELANDAGKLCQSIENLPASEQQTSLSLQAAALRANVAFLATGPTA